jgi:hypothetical protein
MQAQNTIDGLSGPSPAITGKTHTLFVSHCDLP